MSSFNFTNVEINSGRKQIIDIEDDKKVIDDRGASKNYQPIVECLWLTYLVQLMLTFHAFLDISQKPK